MALARPEDHESARSWSSACPAKNPPHPPANRPRPLTGPLSGFRRKSEKAPRAKTPENQVKPEKDRAPRGQSLLPRPGPAPLAAVPQNGSDGLAAAAAMQERARLLQAISARHLRHLARPFWRAGWRPADVLHALDHEPGGRQHGYTAAVRSPAAWIRSRLDTWRGPDGAPLPSPGQQRAAAAAATRAAAAARREEAARLAAGRTADNDSWADRARAMLAARGGTVARDLARWQARPGGPGPQPAAP